MSNINKYVKFIAEQTSKGGADKFVVSSETPALHDENKTYTHSSLKDAKAKIAKIDKHDPNVGASMIIHHTDASGKIHSGPRSYTLLTGFEDTEMAESGTAMNECTK